MMQRMLGPGTTGSSCALHPAPQPATPAFSVGRHSCLAGGERAHPPPCRQHLGATHTHSTRLAAAREPSDQHPNSGSWVLTSQLGQHAPSQLLLSRHPPATARSRGALRASNRWAASLQLNHAPRGGGVQPKHAPSGGGDASQSCSRGEGLQADDARGMQVNDAPQRGACHAGYLGTGDGAWH